MKWILPENGYESPRSPENDDILFGNGIDKKRERRRNGVARGEDETAGGPESADSPLDISREDRIQDRVGESRIIGFRDRVGCYTWTWFTMTMATGGIANVLHSSTIDPAYIYEASL
jgi:hypothetical protein